VRSGGGKKKKCLVYLMAANAESFQKGLLRKRTRGTGKKQFGTCQAKTGEPYSRAFVRGGKTDQGGEYGGKKQKMEGGGWP